MISKTCQVLDTVLSDAEIHALNHSAIYYRRFFNHQSQWYFGNIHFPHVSSISPHPTLPAFPGWGSLLTWLFGTELAPYSPAFAQSLQPSQVLSFLYSPHWTCSAAFSPLWFLFYMISKASRARQVTGSRDVKTCEATPPHVVTRSDISRASEIWPLCEDLLNFEGRHQISKCLKHCDGGKTSTGQTQAQTSNLWPASITFPLFVDILSMSAASLRPHLLSQVPHSQWSPLRVSFRLFSWYLKLKIQLIFFPRQPLLLQESLC